MLQQLAGFNQATYSHVLVAQQTDLYQTISRLRTQKEATQPLHTLLRDAVMSQGGVNADQLRVLVEKTVQDNDDNWDTHLNRPRNGLDLDKKHVNKVGRVLESFYQWREAQEAFKSARHYEEQLDKLVVETEVIRTEIETTTDFLNQNKDAYRDLKVRAKLSLDRQQQEKHAEEMVGVMHNWPLLEANSGFMNERLAYLRAGIAKLESEAATARKVASAQHLLLLHQKAQLAKASLDRANEERNQLRKVTADDCRKANLLSEAIRTMEIRMEAQRLQFHIHPNADCVVLLTRGLEAGQEVALRKGEVYKAHANGKFTLSTGTLSITTISGAGEVEQTLVILEEKKRELADWLTSFGCSSVAALEAQAKIFQQANDRVSRCQTELSVLIRDTSLEVLEREVTAIQELPATRSMKDIQDELISHHTEVRDTERKLTEARSTLLGYAKQYGSVTALTETWQNAKSQIQALNDQLKVLRMLPENYSRPEDFVADYETSQRLYQQTKDNLHQYELDRKELEKSAPEWSSEELAGQVERALCQLDQRKQEATAYRKIQADLAGLLAGIHAQTYEPLYQRTKWYLSELTGGRYADLAMEESLPLRIGSNGASLSVELLSQGTAGSLALALRLAMAEHYLVSSEGFLVLDDPLVDMDPVRQQAAAKCLHAYSSKKQVIVFTCHPSHAELLGANRILLNHTEKVISAY